MEGGRPGIWGRRPAVDWSIQSAAFGISEVDPRFRSATFDVYEVDPSIRSATFDVHEVDPSTRSATSDVHEVDPSARSADFDLPGPPSSIRYAPPPLSMRILAINQFYAPDEAATSQLLTDLCEDLAEAGHEVSVIAGRGHYLGGERFLPRETRRGVEIVRPWSTSLGKGNIPRRLADYGSFFATAIAKAASISRPDVILALTTPPLISAGAALVARGRGVPLVVWAQDIYPQIAIELGVLRRSHPATAFFDQASRATYRQAAKIVALSSGMAERLESFGAPREKVRVIHNWADGEALVPVEASENPFRKEQGLEGKFVAMYSGNLGAAHDVATMIGAARLLEERAPRIEFVIVGEGMRREEAEELAQGLGNIRFLPYQPREKLGESLASADVHLVTLREGFEGLLVPSKMYGAIATGRPIAFVGPGGCEVARAIREERLGWAGRPGDAEALANAIYDMANDESAYREVASRARGVFLERYESKVATKKWEALLREAWLSS